MEVHHPKHLTHKKKWLEYLLEFVMLFLAVFLGFLAENQREHIVEAHRAKDYAKSFLNDLKADTSDVRGAIESEKFRADCMDSLVLISRSLNDQLVVPGKFYYFSRFMSNLYTVDWNSSTISQLVQSGNLRYFSNKELVAKINAYYSAQQLTNNRTRISHETRMKAIDLRNRILQSQYATRFESLDFMQEQKGHIPSPRIDSLINALLPLTKYADQYFDEYINLLSDWKWRLELNSRSYPGLIQMATEIMQLLKDEYDLHD